MLGSPAATLTETALPVWLAVRWQGHWTGAVPGTGCSWWKWWFSWLSQTYWRSVRRQWWETRWWGAAFAHKNSNVDQWDMCHAVKISVYLLQDVQSHWIKHVVNDDSKHGARRWCQVQNSRVGRRWAPVLNGWHSLQHSLRSLVEKKEVALIQSRVHTAATSDLNWSIHRYRYR